MVESNLDFDIALAAAFEPEEDAKPKFPFYEAIGRRLERIRKKVWLPHKELDLTWNPKKIYQVANEIVIPSVDLVLLYVGIPSTAAGIMAANAARNGKPIVYFHESGVTVEPQVRELPNSTGFTFKSEPDALEALEEMVRKFYRL